MAERRPDFFLVGAPKCGTTALHVHLGRHPEVFVPAEKELNHFATDLLRPDDPARSREGWLNHFRGAGDAKAVGDSSVFHLLSREAAANIRAFAPDARILILLREPVSWLASYHAQMVYNGDEDLPDLERALAAEPARRRGLGVPAHLRFPERLHYTRVAAFAEQVERYLQAFGRERVRVMLQEDWLREPRQLHRETLRFLGVDPDFEVPASRENPRRELRSAALSELLRRPPAWLARPVTALLPAAARGALRRRVRRWNSRVAESRPLAPELRARLREQFRPEVERLSALLGRDLSVWCRDP